MRVLRILVRSPVSNHYNFLVVQLLRNQSITIVLGETYVKMFSAKSNVNRHLESLNSKPKVSLNKINVELDMSVEDVNEDTEDHESVSQGACFQIYNANVWCLG